MDVVARLRTLAVSPDALLLPAASDDDIASLTRRFPVPVPTELVRLLAVTTGSRRAGSLLDLDLTGSSHDVEASELLPAGHPVASDGAGNFWLLDLTPDTTESAPVFFLSHDPPVLLYQWPDLAAFVDALLDDSGAVADRAHEQALQVYGSRPGALSYESAATRGDQALRDLAHRLGDGWTYVDLRQRTEGDGLVWGRYGPRTRLARAGWERMFGYAPYLRPRRSWRRFGRVAS